MNQDQVIAEKRLLFINPEGKEILSSVQLGKPYHVDNLGTLCDFEIPKIFPKQYSVGSNGIQAIILGMSTMKSVIGSKLKKGWKIYWPDTKVEMELNNVFDISTLIEKEDDN